MANVYQAFLCFELLKERIQDNKGAPQWFAAVHLYGFETCEAQIINPDDMIEVKEKKCI